MFGAKLEIELVLAVALCLQVVGQVTLGSMLSDYTLNKQWKALHTKQGTISCEKDALNAWLFFGEQREIDDKFMTDLVEFPRKCDYHKLLDEKFARNEARVYENVRKPLYEFLSDEFIARYKRDNLANEPAVHLDDNSGYIEQRCCNPDARSEGASREAIERLAARENSKLAKLISKHKAGGPRELKRALEEYFEINVAITCETYWQILHHHLFRGLIGAMNKFMNGDWTFKANQSDKFRAGIFRYQFCRQLTSNRQLRANYIKALATFGSEAQ